MARERRPTDRMNLPLNHRVLLARPLPAADAQALLGMARALHRAAQEGLDPLLLKGRHMGVVADPPGRLGPAAEAARNLGARLSPIRIEPGLLDRREPDLARMLARLYDAVAMEDLAPDRAAALQQALGLPVFSGLAAQDHPLRALELSMPAGGNGYVLQALVLNTMGH